MLRLQIKILHAYDLQQQQNRENMGRGAGGRGAPTFVDKNDEVLNKLLFEKDDKTK